MSEKQENIKTGRIGPIIGVSEACKDIIQKLLSIDPSKRPTIQEVFEHRFVTDQVKKGGEEFSRRYYKARQKNATKNPALMKLQEQAASQVTNSQTSTDPPKSHNMLPKTATVVTKSPLEEEQAFGNLANSREFMSDSANVHEDSLQHNLTVKLSSGFVKTNQKPKTISVSKPQNDRNSLMEQEDLEDGLNLIGGSKDQDLYNQLSMTLDKKSQPKDDPFKKSAHFAQVSNFAESIVLNEPIGKSSLSHQQQSLKGSSPEKANYQMNSKQNHERESRSQDQIQLSFAAPPPQVSMSKQKAPAVHVVEPSKPTDMDLYESSILDEVMHSNFDDDDHEDRNGRGNHSTQKPFDFLISNGLADQEYIKQLAQRELNEQKAKDESSRPQKDREQIKPKEAPNKVNRTFQPIEKIDTTPAQYKFPEEETKSKLKLGPANVNKWMNSKVDLDT